MGGLRRRPADHARLVRKQFDCRGIADHVRPAAGEAETAWEPWHSVLPLPGGNVHVSALPVLDGSQPLGFLVLVHDLSFIERRETKTQQFLLLAFSFLAIAASAVTIVAARLSWRGSFQQTFHGEETRSRGARSCTWSCSSACA